MMFSCNCTDPDCHAPRHGATPEELDRYFAKELHVLDAALAKLPPGAELPEWAVVFVAMDGSRAVDEVAMDLAGSIEDLDALLDGAADTSPAFVHDDTVRHDAWDQWVFGPARTNEVMAEWDDAVREDCTAPGHRVCVMCD